MGKQISGRPSDGIDLAHFSQDSIFSNSDAVTHPEFSTLLAKKENELVVGICCLFSLSLSLPPSLPPSLPVQYVIRVMFYP